MNFSAVFTWQQSDLFFLEPYKLIALKKDHKSRASVKVSTSSSD